MTLACLLVALQCHQCSQCRVIASWVIACACAGGYGHTGHQRPFCDVRVQFCVSRGSEWGRGAPCLRPAFLLGRCGRVRCARCALALLPSHGHGTSSGLALAWVWHSRLAACLPRRGPTTPSAGCKRGVCCVGSQVRSAVSSANFATRCKPIFWSDMLLWRPCHAMPRHAHARCKVV